MRYNYFFALFQMVIHTLTEYSFNLIPVLIIFFARALSFQFRRLMENAAGTDESESHFSDLRGKGTLSLNSIEFYEIA